MIAIVHTKDDSTLKVLYFEDEDSLLIAAVQKANLHRPHTETDFLLTSHMLTIEDAARHLVEPYSYAAIIRTHEDVAELHDVLRKIMEHYGSLVGDLATNFPPPTQPAA